MKLYDEKKIKQNLKVYKNFPINDQRVFTLVKKFIKGQCADLTQQKDTIIDENFLYQNEKDISFKLAKIIKNRGYLLVYEKLKQKFNEYKKLMEEYDKLPILYKDFHKSDECESTNEKLRILTNKLIFSLVELKVNLGLDLHDIALCDIIFYSIAMSSDISNGEYETLSIDKHINSENGYININKNSQKIKSLANN